MFTPEELEFMPREIEKMYSDLEWRIMMDIVRRLQLAGEITRTADWQTYRASELGKSKAEIKKFIKEIMTMSEEEIDRIYEEAIASGYVRDKRLYEALGKDFIPYAENAVLQKMVKAIKDQTKEQMKNITQSIGFAKVADGKVVFTELADFYQKTLDDAVLDITSGAFDYNSVLKRTIDTMTNSGLRTVDYASGWHNRVEVAARRALMTGLSQITGKINEQNAQKLGTEYFEVTRHVGARPDHQLWQGKVYTMEQLRSVCGYGEVTGLKGANCHHDFEPFFPGIDERRYTDEELERLNKEENTPKEWNGKGYTAYEATQKQRRMETTIRAQKRKINLMEEGGADADTITAAKCRWRKKMSDYADFSHAMRLPQQRNRFYIGKSAKESAQETSKDRLGLFSNNDKRNPKYYDYKGKTIGTVEKELSKIDYEVGVIFDENGKAISCQLGEEDSITFTKHQLKLMKGRDITHCHPLGTPPSPEDLYLMINSKAKSFRTCGKNGVYVLKYTKEVEKLPEFTVFGMEYDNILKSLQPKYLKKVQEGMRQEDALVALGEEIWDELYAKYGVRPEFERR